MQQCMRRLMSDIDIQPGMSIRVNPSSIGPLYEKCLPLRPLGNSLAEVTIVVPTVFEEMDLYLTGFTLQSQLTLDVSLQISKITNKTLHVPQRKL